MTAPADALRDAVSGLVAVATEAGLPADTARVEALCFAAAIAESAPRAALDWAVAAGLEAADPAAANTAFFEAASSGRKWRQAPTAGLSELAATSSPHAGPYAARLADIAAAACLLGEPTPRVAGNASVAAAAQQSIVPIGSAGMPPTGHPSAPPPAPAQPPAPAPAPAQTPVLGVGDPFRIPNLTELMLDNQRRVTEQLAAIERLRGGPMLTPPGGPAPGSPPPGAVPANSDSPEQPPAAGQAQGQAETQAEGASQQAPPKTLEELLAELEDLVGLEAVKKEINQQVAILKVEQRRAEAGLKSATITRHLVFVGNPGTGKTTVARLIGGIYRALGLLSKGQLIEVDRSELVAGYLGQTAIKTAEVVGKALGGVLFIDEAYGLSGDQYGQEAINTLVKEMEDNRDNLVVIVAGYPTPMMEFIAQNPGLASRFKTMIEFADYTDAELMGIITGLAAKSDYDITPEAETVVSEVLAATERNFTFGNGRFVRNLLEEAIGRHAWRLRDAVDLTTEQLRQLLPADFREAAAGDHQSDAGDRASAEQAELADAAAEMTAEGGIPEPDGEPEPEKSESHPSDHPGPPQQEGSGP